MTQFLIISIILLAVMVIGGFMWMNQQPQEIYTEIATSEDDPYLKWLSEVRQSYIENIVLALQKHWGCDENSILLRIDQTGESQNLVQMHYSDCDVTLYCNWAKKRIKMQYVVNADEAMCFTTVFKLKDNFLDLREVDDVLTDIAETILKENTKDDKVTAAIQVAAELAEEPEEKVKEYLFLVAERWSFPKGKKAFKKSLTQYVRLNTFLIKFFKEDYVKFLQRHVPQNSEENNEEKEKEVE